MNLIYVYKAAGAVLVMIAGIYISWDYSHTVNGELDSARDAERLIRYIGECIAYSGNCIGEIILSYAGDCEPARTVWQSAGETTLSEALLKPDLPFDGTTRQILSGFASQLGRGYREPQIELCRKTSERLASHITDLESSKKDRLRVGSAICFFVSVSLVILLI